VPVAHRLAVGIFSISNATRQPVSRSARSSTARASGRPTQRPPIVNGRGSHEPPQPRSANACIDIVHYQPRHRRAYLDTRSRDGSSREIRMSMQAFAERGLGGSWLPRPFTIGGRWVGATGCSCGAGSRTSRRRAAAWRSRSRRCRRARRCATALRLHARHTRDGPAAPLPEDVRAKYRSEVGKRPPASGCEFPCVRRGPVCLPLRSLEKALGDSIW